MGTVLMADQIDIANDMVQRNLDAVLDALAGANAFSDDCIECGEFIPDERQKITGGTEFCTKCMSIIEAKSRLYR